MIGFSYQLSIVLSPYLFKFGVTQKFVNQKSGTKERQRMANENYLNSTEQRILDKLKQDMVHIEDDEALFSLKRDRVRDVHWQLPPVSCPL